MKTSWPSSVGLICYSSPVCFVPVSPPTCCFCCFVSPQTNLKSQQQVLFFLWPKSCSLTKIWVLIARFIKNQSSTKWTWDTLLICFPHKITTSIALYFQCFLNPPGRRWFTFTSVGRGMEPPYYYATDRNMFLVKSIKLSSNLLYILADSLSSLLIITYKSCRRFLCLGSDITFDKFDYKFHRRLLP